MKRRFQKIAALMLVGAMAGCISVGSPTMANETGGSPCNTLSIPSLPETSSSQEAR